MENWFKHDANAHADAKLMQLLMCNKVYYANYFLTLEWLFLMDDATASEKELNGLAYFLHESKSETDAFLKLCIELDLFVLDSNKFYSLRLREQKTLQNDKSASAKAKAEKRWNKKNATAVPQQCHSNAEEKRREEKRREEDKSKDLSIVDLSTNENVQKLYEFYITISKRPKVILTNKRKNLIVARLKEYAFDDIRRSWSAMAADEFLRGKNQGSKDYFDLEYACRQDRLEHYLNHFITKIEYAS